MCCMQASFLSASGGMQLSEKVSGILKTLITNQLALKFNWKGSQAKLSFADLKLSTVICGKLVHVGETGAGSADQGYLKCKASENALLTILSRTTIEEIIIIQLHLILLSNLVGLMSDLLCDIHRV